MFFFVTEKVMKPTFYMMSSLVPKTENKKTLLNDSNFEVKGFSYKHVIIIIFSKNSFQILLYVNSVQEACTKCFAVHMLKFEILQTVRKNKTKSIKNLDLLINK